MSIDSSNAREMMRVHSEADGSDDDGYYCVTCRSYIQVSTGRVDCVPDRTQSCADPCAIT